MTTTITPTTPTSRIAQVFTIAARVEAATWVGLLVGMYLKHISGSTELGVQIFGPIHGWVFLAYLAIALLAARRLRWDGRTTVLALLAAIPPLMTIPFEMWARRTGRLQAPLEESASS